MKTIYCVPVLLMFGSCATVMNKSFTTINIHSEKPGRLTMNGERMGTIPLNHIVIKRSADSLVLIAETDSLKKEVILKPKNSTAYYLNLCTVYFLGFIIDHKNPKRYTYQQDVYVDYDSPSPYPRKFVPNKKGELDLFVSIPYVNGFYLQPQGEPTKRSVGFWGIAAGADYYYKDNKYLRISANTLTDYPIPFPVGICGRDSFETMTSTYIALTDNFQFNRFTLGYGINYSKNNWKCSYDIPHDSLPTTKKSNYSFGLTFSGYYQTGKHFNIGLIYRPTFWMVKPTTGFKYEHLISLDLAWKWRVINPKKRK